MKTFTRSIHQIEAAMDDNDKIRASAFQIVASCNILQAKLHRELSEILAYTAPEYECTYLVPKTTEDNNQ